MSEIVLRPKKTLALRRLELALPALILEAGPQASRRFVEFFTATIRNPNTREAYGRAVRDFFAWCDLNGLGSLESLEPIHVASYIEGHPGKPATVKQHLAALRMCFDWLVTGQVITNNPAASVRGPKLKYTKGKTPILDSEEAKALFAAIPTSTPIGLRDRTLCGVLLYSFARISAALSMNVEDFYSEARAYRLRLHEKGGLQHSVPAHHLVVEYLDAYLKVLPDPEPSSPLFRTVDRHRQLTNRRLHRTEALAMIRRKAKAAGLEGKIGNHSFRATGITVFRKNGGSLEEAQEIAAHADPKTTRLYDRSRDAISVAAVEKIAL